MMPHGLRPHLFDHGNAYAFTYYYPYVLAPRHLYFGDAPYRYDAYYGPVYGPLLPPIGVPAGDLFGPRAVWQTLGFRNQAPVVPQRPRSAGPGNGRGVANGPLAAGKQVAEARARRAIQRGDALFRHHQFRKARDRYRNATRSAPHLADVFFRRGTAELALGLWDAAAASFRRGLALPNDWAASPFRWEDVYGEDGRTAQEKTLDRLVREVTRHPLNGDRMFLLGLQLHFDGQAERAAIFFRRAAQLLRNPAYLMPFLAIDQPVQPRRGREM